MARCPTCGAELENGTSRCPACPEARAERPPSPVQPPLPFSPWVGTPVTAPASGGAIALPAPAVDTPLRPWQVALAVGAILLLLFLVMLIGQGIHGRPAQTAREKLPVLGMIGEPITIGNTVVGVAFTNTTERLGQRESIRGRFFAVGVVVGNRSTQAVTLSDASLALVDAGNGERFTPVMTAWGSPEELNAGQFAPHFSLQPKHAIAGILVFDTPVTLAAPQLLVRDLTVGEASFTGGIDLTKEKKK